MTTTLEPARPTTIPRGEATARVELAALGRRLAAAHDAEVPVEKMMEDVARTWQKCDNDVKYAEEQCRQS